MNSITQGLMAAGCEVRVLAMCSDKHPVHDELMTPEYKKATRFEAVYVDLGIHPLDAAVAALCGESYHVKRFVSKDFSAKLKQVLEEETFDVVHVESLFLTPYVPLVRKYSKAQVYLRAHNVEHQIWERVAQGVRNPFKRQYMKHLALTLRAYECEHLNDYDGVVSITESDAKTLKSLGCRKPVVAIPFGISAEAMGHVDEEPCSLFHLGSMDWIPNQEGVRWFLEKVWPMVHERVPQVTLYLAGRKMPECWMHAAIDGVSVVGEVPDAGYFIAGKQINVVPLRSGSGIRVKIIEAMAAGKAVVTTTVGAQGIEYTDGENLLIADTPEQFASHIKRLVEDQDYCARVGEAAARLVAEQYDVKKLTGRLLRFYEEIMER